MKHTEESIKEIREIEDLILLGASIEDLKSAGYSRQKIYNVRHKMKNDVLMSSKEFTYSNPEPLFNHTRFDFSDETVGNYKFK